MITEGGPVTINERAAEEFFKRAREADAQGNTDKAIEFYERTLAENPDHEQACFQLALLYDRCAEDAKAIELYERLTTSQPVHINALLNLAVLYEDHNHYDEAYRCLEAILRTNPNHERARLYMKDVESARANYVSDDDRSGSNRERLLEDPITSFDLSVRARNALKKMNIRTLGDLLRYTEAELLSFKNFGETSLNEIKNLLASKGLRLGQYADPSARRPGLPGSASAMPPIAPDLMNKPVTELELNVRARKALQRLNIQTVGELVQRTEDELLACKNFGTTSLNELKQQLAQLGLSLRSASS